MKQSYFILLFLSLSLHLEAQTRLSCQYYESKIIVVNPSSQFSTNDEASRIVTDICKATNYSVRLIIRPATVENACATTDIIGQKLILYNVQFIRNTDYQTRTDWGSISIVAHEIGHHYYGLGNYTDNSAENHKQELNADFFSGYALAKMGASLEEAQAAMKTIASDNDSDTHPARYRRLNAIENGWVKGGGQKRMETPEEPRNSTRDRTPFTIPKVIVVERQSVIEPRRSDIPMPRQTHVIYFQIPQPLMRVKYRTAPVYPNPVRQPQCQPVRSIRRW